MAMTPEERIEFNQMKATLQNLQRVEDVAFVENIKRRLDIPTAVTNTIAETNIGALANVDTSGVTNDQVLKYNSANETWEPANDIDT